MLKKLQIRNFQVHRNLELKLDPGINVIVGNSDVGKSAILRALRWVFLNAPNGTAHIRNGSKGCMVSVDVDGHKITRVRSRKSNSYRAFNKKYSAVGSSVPSPIVDLAGIEESNFQQQYDSPFWISLSGLEVSKQLNSIVDLSSIDELLATTATLVRTAVISVGVVDSKYVAIQKEGRSLAWTRRCEKELHNIETIETSLVENETDIVALQSELEKIDKADCTRPPTLPTSLLILTQEIEDISNQYATLQELIDQIKEQVINSVRFSKQILKLEKDHKMQIKGQLCPVCGQTFKE